MSERIILGPTDRLIEIVSSRLEAQGRDYSHTAIVFPGNAQRISYVKNLLPAQAAPSFPLKYFPWIILSCHCTSSFIRSPSMIWNRLMQPHFSTPFIRN